MTDMQTILVVDDDEDFRHATCLILESAGYRVATAADGEEAARLTEAEKPDLVLIDVMMEEIDAGFVFAERYGHDLPVILLSSIADSSVKVFDAHKLPVRSVLQKPVKPDRLLECVAAALSA